MKSGTAVFIGLSPVAEEALIDSLGSRIVEPVAVRESETGRIVGKGGGGGLSGPYGTLQLKGLDQHRLLLVAQALGMSVAMAEDERRIAGTFDNEGSLTR